MHETGVLQTLPLKPLMSLSEPRPVVQIDIMTNAFVWIVTIALFNSLITPYWMLIYKVAMEKMELTPIDVGVCVYN